MQLLFATHNPWKAQLFQPVFENYGFEMLSLRDLPPNSETPVETGATAMDNAIMKALYYHSTAYPWVFADDAGLEIAALNGEPGLQARRWNGHFCDDVDDQTWLDYLLQRLENVPLDQRSAAFVSGWALVAPDRSFHTRSIRWPFQISTHPLRPLAPGSPISAVRIGPPDDLAHRREAIRLEWMRWGIFETLLQKKDIL